jgi:two-component system, cell cycle response regulator DivK
MDRNTTDRKKDSILVVDDSGDMRVLLGRILEKAGYHVLFAENGHTSLIQAKLYHPRLILMDLSLPDISGWEAVRELRQMSEFRTTPIIAITAHVSSAEIEHATTIGCTAHIGKPFDASVILRTVASLLRDL